jgi:hypothetical protein
MCLRISPGRNTSRKQRRCFLPETLMNELALQTESTAAAQVVMMTESEARERVEQIKNHFGEIGKLILELYEREGWKALGCNTWRECAVAEFKHSRSRICQLLDAAKVERNVSNMLENDDRLTARAVDQLKHLQPDDQRLLVKEAKEIAPDGRVTDKQIREVKERLEAENDVSPASR